MQFKIITWNIWDIPFWFCTDRKKRLQAIAEYLSGCDADIICLQESFDVRHRVMIHEAIGKEKYFVNDESSEIRRLPSGKKFDTTGGLVIFSKFKITESRFVPFKREWPVTIPERIGKKGFLEATVETPEGAISLLTTHLHAGFSALDRIARLRQIKEIFSLFDEEKNPAIIAGDLNEDTKNVHENTAFFEWFNERGYRDAASHALPAQPTVRMENEYANASFNKARASERVDYIFIKNPGGNTAIAAYKTLPQPVTLSDHDPVFAEIEFK